MAKKRKTTKYQSMLKAGTKVCTNPSKTAKDRLKKSIDAYKKDAAQKGKTKAEIQKAVKYATSCKRKK